MLVYLVRGERLGVAARSVSDTAGIAAAAMRALLSGATSEDTDAGLDTQIPAGTVLNGVRIEGGGAVVDLSEDFESGGGAASMQLRVAQVVYTLTQFSSVENVSFEIDGRPVDAIGGEGVVVSPAVDRDDFEENVLPPIFVESPTPFLEVGDSFRLSGRSNTFEATFVYNVLDAGGKVVKRDFVTATAGSGTWGSFDVFVPLEAISPGNGSLVVFEESAEDGSRINAVRIPIRLVR